MSIPSFHKLFFFFDVFILPRSGMLWGKKPILSALGPLPFGYAYDRLQGYTETLLFMMVFPVLAIVAAFLSPVPDYRQETAFDGSPG